MFKRIPISLINRTPLKKILERSRTLLGAWSDGPNLSIDDPYGRSDARFRVLFSQIKCKCG